MKTLLFIDTSIMIENCDSNVRINQYKEGLTNILKHNNYFSENNIDILLVDNTINSYLDVSNCEFFNVISKNCNCVTYKNNNYGKKNKGSGVFEHWDMINIEIYKKYDYIIHFEARQTLQSLHFFDIFLKNPTSIFSWSSKKPSAITGDFIKNDDKLQIELYGLNHCDMHTHPNFNDFYTGLFSMKMEHFLELLKTTGAKYLINEDISLEKIMMRFVHKNCDKFKIIEKVDLIRYIPISNIVEHH